MPGPSMADLAGDCAARFGNTFREVLWKNQLALQLASEKQEIATGLEDNGSNREIPDVPDLKSGPKRKQDSGQGKEN